MNQEPSPADVAAVAAATGTPAPQPTPAQPVPSAQPVQPVESAPAPQAPAQAPSQPADPFTTFMQPAQPAEPAPQAAPQPAAPAPQAPEAPAQPAAQPPAQDYETYEQYIARVTEGVTQPLDQPDGSKVNPDDPESVKAFFNDLVKTAVTQAEANVERKNAIREAETRQWNQAFDKYGSLRENKNLRDMVHNIRVANFRRGIAMSPTQAADQLLEALKSEYQRGVNDNQVQTTIESVQPNGGGSVPVQTTMEKEEVLKAVQTGGEVALADMLDAEIKAGRL